MYTCVCASICVRVLLCCTQRGTGEWVQFGAHISRISLSLVRSFVRRDGTSLPSRFPSVSGAGFYFSRAISPLAFVSFTYWREQNRSSLSCHMNFHINAETWFPLLVKAMSQIYVDICIRVLACAAFKCVLCDV